MHSLAMLKPVKSILWSVALLLLGNGLLNTLLTLRGTGEGFSSAVLGMIMSGYFVGFICGTWVSGRLIRRMGHIRTFGFCASICASVALLHLVFINPWVWLPLRVAYGLSFITLITVIESWLNSQAASHERGRIFAVYMVVNLGALAIAQQLLRLSSPQGFLLFVVIAILISWALLPITLTRRVQPTIPERPKSSLRTLLGFAPLAVACAALSGLAMGAFWSMTPVYVTQLGFDIGGVGLVMSMAIVGGALLQIPIGRFSDKHDRPRVMTWVVLLAALIAAAMPFAPSHNVLVGLYFIWGGLAFSLYPLAVAQLIDQLHPDEIVSGSADMLVMHGAGCAVAPIAAGSLMTAVGGHGLPIYIACVFALLGAYAIYRRRHVTALITHTAHFEPMVQSGAGALEMIFDDTQPDLFDDPSFYEENERERLKKALSSANA
ncbi:MULTISPECIES: MFS transporter [unclassified Halomonas]|uniref:MFS transporter n=1 Tax=unclassified Halomonas TaxID=2609666 RepID=UPI0006D9E61F|nr:MULTISPECIES: MFS transporter [unclassified Halomonas]KPQ28879.1 MAG: Arabinose efflux permease [Halomonas sp. HL-93]SBR50747.1 Predicted arabinose efflux permease, MFS family [Halomonas sp. HL-93]SNY97015.1 Predicted arabinose efflux permease, MFS family [Halomonas sp. hl-4]